MASETNSQELPVDSNIYGPILETILPPREDSYSITELEQILRVKIDDVEVKQRNINKLYDQVLDDSVLNEIEFLRNNLHTLQLDLMKLQCDVAFTSEQLNTIKTTFNNPAISNRQLLIEKERQLQKSIRQVRFEPLKEFFLHLIKCLDSRIDSCKRVCKQQVLDDLQMFDWNLFQQIMMLLRTCGKILLDLGTSELLFQSSFNIISINFKQPINSIDFNHFVESYESYLLSTLIEVVGERESRIELKEASTSGLPENYTLFDSSHSDVKTLTISCCKLLIDLNMNFIDNLLTEGISIDKLNGNDNSNPLSHADTHTLPLYAFSPQEYVTQIGQHLLTLRKQTQQFDSNENKSLMCGLECLEQAQDIPINVRSYVTVSEIVMRCVSRHCIRSLLGRTNKSILNKLTMNGRRQLSTDALYLDNVLEDLNLLDSNEPFTERFRGLLVQ